MGNRPHDRLGRSIRCHNFLQAGRGSRQGQSDNRRSILPQGHSVDVNPRDYYALLPIEVHAIAIPWERYAQVEVDLEYADPANGLDLRQTLTFSANINATWTIRLSDPRRTGYRYRAIFYPVSGAPIRGDWQDVDQPAITIHDVFSETLKVKLIAVADFTKVMRFLVTMRYTDPANDVEQSDIVVLKSADDLLEWSCRIIDHKKRDYLYLCGHGAIS
jgi:hypothetical protein